MTNRYLLTPDGEIIYFEIIEEQFKDIKHPRIKKKPTQKKPRKAQLQ